MPFVSDYNKQGGKILRVVYRMFDESMSTWRPKTSKTGGPPNITHEARKPVPLGTMICNAVECVTGRFFHHDIIQGPVQKWKKKYSDPPVKSHLPINKNIQYHVTKVLCQAENSKVVEGGWVGGDA